MALRGTQGSRGGSGCARCGLRHSRSIEAGWGGDGFTGGGSGDGCGLGCHDGSDGSRGRAELRPFRSLGAVVKGTLGVLRESLRRQGTVRGSEVESSRGRRERVRLESREPCRKDSINAYRIACRIKRSSPCPATRSALIGNSNPTSTHSSILLALVVTQRQLVQAKRSGIIRSYISRNSARPPRARHALRSESRSERAKGILSSGRDSAGESGFTGVGRRGELCGVLSGDGGGQGRGSAGSRRNGVNDVGVFGRSGHCYSPNTRGCHCCTRWKQTGEAET